MLRFLLYLAPKKGSSVTWDIATTRSIFFRVDESKDHLNDKKSNIFAQSTKMQRNKPHCYEAAHFSWKKNKNKKIKSIIKNKKVIQSPNISLSVSYEIFQSITESKIFTADSFSSQEPGFQLEITLEKWSNEHQRKNSIKVMKQWYSVTSRTNILVKPVQLSFKLAAEKKKREIKIRQSSPLHTSRIGKKRTQKRDHQTTFA